MTVTLRRSARSAEPRRATAKVMPLARRDAASADHPSRLASLAPQDDGSGFLRFGHSLKTSTRENDISENRMSPLPSQRHLFDIPDDVAFLNCAYISPLPKASIAAGEDGARRKGRPWTIVPDDFFTAS